VVVVGVINLMGAVYPHGSSASGELGHRLQCLVGLPPSPPQAGKQRNEQDTASCYENGSVCASRYFFQDCRYPYRLQVSHHIRRHHLAYQHYSLGKPHNRPRSLCRSPYCEIHIWAKRDSQRPSVPDYSSKSSPVQNEEKALSRPQPYGWGQSCEWQWSPRSRSYWFGSTIGRFWEFSEWR
jgi:hypothetical protein